MVNDACNLKPSHLSLLGVIFEVSEERVVIAFNSPPEEDFDGVFHLHLLSNDVTYRRMKASMEGLKKAAFETRNHVVDVLFNRSEPNFSPNGLLSITLCCYLFSLTICIELP